MPLCHLYCYLLFVNVNTPNSSKVRTTLPALETIVQGSGSLYYTEQFDGYLQFQHALLAHQEEEC